jgi:nucleolar protein 14
MHSSTKVNFNSFSKRVLPTASETFLLSLIGDLYSTSDLKHPVVTPAMLLMCQYLETCPVQSPKDMLVILNLCNILYKVKHPFFRLMDLDLTP